jgi:hypothetical protein
MNNNDMQITQEELDEIRKSNNARNREWWAKQSPEERRARRQRYALNLIRNKKGKEQED